MATTSPDNIWTPDSGDGYALTQDLAAFADTTQDALVVRANYYTGDNSQMANQESKATEGSMFFNTDDDKEYRLVSGAWVIVNESDWIAYTATIGAISGTFSVGTGGSAEKTTEYKYINGRVLVRYKFVLGASGASMGTGPYFSLPMAATPPAPRYSVVAGDGTIYDLSATLNYYTKARFNDGSATQVLISNYAGSFTNITASSPMTWAAGDVLQGEFWIDPA